VKRASRPAVTILDEPKATEFQKADDVVFVAQINPKDELVAAAYKSIAHRYMDRASFGFMETSEETTVICYKNRDEDQSIVADFTAVDTLDVFVVNCLTPLIEEFSRRNELKYFEVSQTRPAS
jgi:hypothetical protein